MSARRIPKVLHRVPIGRMLFDQPPSLGHRFVGVPQRIVRGGRSQLLRGPFEHRPHRDARLRTHRLPQRLIPRIVQRVVVDTDFRTSGNLVFLVYGQQVYHAYPVYQLVQCPGSPEHHSRGQTTVRGCAPFRRIRRQRVRIAVVDRHRFRRDDDVRLGLVTYKTTTAITTAIGWSLKC